jgi:hypothetical protein
MAWRPLVLAGIFLIQYALLWLGWGCYRRPFSKRQVTRAIVFALLGVFLFLQFAGGAVYVPVPSCLQPEPASPISFRPPGDLLNLSPAGPAR